MTTRRRRMLEDLQPRGLAPKTQPGYGAAVHQRARHEGRVPDQLNQAALRQRDLVPVRALSQLFRGRFRDLAPKAGPARAIPESV